MRLHLQREPTLASGATHGALYIDGVWHCWTLEDAIREPLMRVSLTGTLAAWVASWKVPGATAIPAGTYPVTITESIRFRRPMPLVGAVPGFEGVRLHYGNTIDDTSGCPLLGRDRADGRVLRSQLAFHLCFEQLSAAVASGDVVTLTILNPLAGWPPPDPPATMPPSAIPV